MQIVAATAWLLAAGLLIRFWLGAKGMTVRIPLTWGCLGMLCLAASQAAQGLQTNHDSPSGVFLEELGTGALLCPMVGLMGAKRPQARVWPWIVLSLWAVLVLPAAEAIWIREQTMADRYGPRAGFQVVLVLLGAGNYLATRHAGSALLFATAQGLMVGQQYDIVVSFPPGAIPLGASLLVLISIVLVWLEVPSGRSVESGLDRCWRDFRDMHGWAWSLRVAERLNAFAQKHGWSERLEANRVQAAPVSQASGDPSQDRHPDAAFDRCFRMLLRSFVSQEWIDSRMNDGDR